MTEKDIKLLSIGMSLGVALCALALTIAALLTGCSSPTNPALGEDEETLFETISVDPFDTGSIEFETVSYDPPATVSIVEPLDTVDIVPLETVSWTSTDDTGDDTGEDTGEDSESIEEDSEEDTDEVDTDEDNCKCHCHHHGKHKCHKKCHHNHGHKHNGKDY